MTNFSTSELLEMANLSNFAYLDHFDQDRFYRLESSYQHIEISTPQYFDVPIIDPLTGGLQYKLSVTDGYTGHAFFNDQTNTLVIANQGTQGWVDWQGNLAPNGVVQDGADHAQLSSAQAFSAQMIARYPNANIVFTGDSLGAYLSTLLSYNHPNAVSIVFDAPGVDVGQLGTNNNVVYYYTENWGLDGTLVHTVGDRASENVYLIPGSSGHSLDSIIEALESGRAVPISLEQYQYIKYENYAGNVATSSISSAHILATQEGNTFEQALVQTLSAAVNMDEELLNSPAFMSAIYAELGDDANQIIAEVVHETNGQCFPAGTLISMANGTRRRIEVIRAGDIVLSFDPATGVHLPRKVTKLYRGETDVWFHLTYNQNGLKKSLSTTPEQPLLTANCQFAPISHVTLAGERWAA